jgi:hypothetical protein
MPVNIKLKRPKHDSQNQLMSSKSAGGL